MNYQEQLYLLESQADMMPEGTAKVMMLEQAIQLADTHNELIDSFELREKLISAAISAGDPMKMIVAFSWCLAQIDKNPHLFEQTRLLWQYKWIACYIDCFPQITKEQIDGLMNDMKRRYEEEGLSLRPYYRLRHSQAMCAGDKALCETYYRKWLSAPVDDFCDCIACEQSHQVEYMAMLGEDERALALAEPILAGKMSCNTVPHETYQDLLLPLVRLGRIDEAMELQKKGYAKIENEPSFVSGYASQIRFLALFDPKQAVKVFQQQARKAFSTNNMRSKFHFFLASWLLFERLQKDGQETLALNAFDGFPVERENGACRVTDLCRWFARETRFLADAFDQRNGNEHHKARIRETLALLK
jgi:hypothetical protein